MYIGNGGAEAREWGTERYEEQTKRCSEDDKVHLGDREKMGVV